MLIVMAAELVVVVAGGAFVSGVLGAGAFVSSARVKQTLKTVIPIKARAKKYFFIILFLGEVKLI